MQRIMALVAFSVLGAGPEPVYAQNVGALLKGGEIAKQICTECHAVQKGQLRSPNTLAPTFETVAMTPGMTPIALTVVLRTSHRTMPNIILTDGDLRNVVAYILNLQ